MDAQKPRTSPFEHYDIVTKHLDLLSQDTVMLHMFAKLSNDL